jgi:hypothetical protein
MSRSIEIAGVGTLPFTRPGRSAQPPRRPAFIDIEGKRLRVGITRRNWSRSPSRRHWPPAPFICSVLRSRTCSLARPGLFWRIPLLG